MYEHTHIQKVILIDPLYSVCDKDNIQAHIRSALDERYYDKEKSKNERNILWEDFLKIGKDGVQLPEVGRDNILYSAFTSGTTGKRKEVMHTSESILGVIQQIALLPPHESPRPKWLLAVLPPTLVVCITAMMFYPLISGMESFL